MERATHPGIPLKRRRDSELRCLFKEAIDFWLACCHPVDRIASVTHEAMKARMRPVAHARHMAMLDWIEVDVIDVVGPVAIIADRVLPEAPVPDAALALLAPSSRQRLVVRSPPRKAGLDRMPA